MEMSVEVEVGYTDKLYCSASLYLSITDDEDDEVIAKTLLSSYYPVQLPIDIEVVRVAIQPGITYLINNILELPSHKLGTS